ncbi:ribonuclease H-like domain-containing protein [Gloeopeniophorella convolvens]|nr:ribonuclease H-like domain-containing protein [Gloeopeniophorella convolvens]
MAPNYGSPTPDQILALSCTVVGAGPGGNTPMVARVAISDFRGAHLLDCYVVPTMAVTDYRTSTTGITPANLTSASAVKFPDVQRLVADMIKDKVIVGHSLWNDLSVLGVPHPAVNTRDVALYQPFRNALRSPNQLVRLPTLTFQLMGRRCQDGQQNPLENARAALDLYRSCATEWEGMIRSGQWPSALPPSTFSRCYL